MQGHQVSHTLVAELLNDAGYSLQGNRKTTEGESHPDRDARFDDINTQVTAALADKQPAISLDTEKKELVGDFRNNGGELISATTIKTGLAVRCQLDTAR